MITMKGGIFLTLVLLLPSISGTFTKPENDSSVVALEKESSHIHIHEESNTSTNFNVTLEESLYFVKKIFVRYGDENYLSKHHLEEMLAMLGLWTTHGEEPYFHNKPEDKDDHDHKEESHHPERHFLEKVKRSIEVRHIHSSHDQCLKLESLLEAFHLDTNQYLSMADFTKLCPAVLQQLTIKECRSDHSHSHTEDEGVSKDTLFNLSKIPARVWGFSTVAVLIISLAGLLGVAVIPIMQKVFYNHLLQFLVALAIGALSGDALLHLLPHAIVGTLGKSHSSHGKDGEEEDDDHTTTAWMGLMALGGILFFFITERLMTILTTIKHRKKSKKLKEKKHCVKYCDVESSEKESVAGKLNARQGNEDDCDKMVMLVHPNKALKSFADATHDELLHQCDDEDISMMPEQLRVSVEDGRHHHEHNDDEVDNGFGEGFSSLGHSHGGHSHGGHGHAVPNSVSAVAWMVILGDGIHNFSDGLAIGASFANSITGGFSTSVAVFCHELPHEIGDFAVLLRAGMSAKQAALYNCLSSFLCFLGMLIGVSIGNISSASLWVFAAVGGMFLYISLVDMLPEMTQVESKKGENPFLHLLLQVVGILLGSSIMLSIALYEHEIKKAFG